MWKLSISALLGVIVAGKIILAFLGWLIWRTYRQGNAHRSGSHSGPARMIGLEGKALTDIAPEGRVAVLGEYWWACARTRIVAGEKVRVTGIEGMLLEVEPCPDKHGFPRQVSAVLSSDDEIQ